MLYIDYIWDLTENTIIPDSDINTEDLNWNLGDCWIVEESNGRKFLKKVDPLVGFLVQGQKHGHS